MLRKKFEDGEFKKEKQRILRRRRYQFRQLDLELETEEKFEE